MSDPTYDREVIRKNPIWNEAFILSEVLNDSAPLRWGRYIYAAEELARNRPPADYFLRQAIEALRKVTSALNGRVHSNPALAALAECEDVLTAYDKREQS